MAADENFLSRWSRRKIESRSPPAAAEPAVPVAGGEPEKAPANVAKASAAPAPAVPAAAATPLPPLESLTPQSDFAPFMTPGVGNDVRQQALKALFRDPHFNVVDMLDVYMDDYSLPDPLPEGWLEKLEQVSHLGDRGARDLEEARRRLAAEKAEAGEGEGTTDAAAGTPPAAEENPAAAEATASNAQIPPTKVGESGT